MPRDISIELGDNEALLRVGLYRALRDAVRRSLVAIGAGPGALVVDVGAGRGELLRLLREDGVEGLGLDPEPDCVAAASVHGRCERGGVEDLARVLAGRRPAAVVCSHVLEHLRAPAEALETMLETGARAFILAVPNVHRPSRMLRVALGGRRPDHPAHIYGWGLAEFRALLEATGFEVAGWHVDRVTVNPTGRAWLTRRLRPLEERWLPGLAPNLSSSLIAECRPS